MGIVPMEYHVHTAYIYLHTNHDYLVIAMHVFFMHTYMMIAHVQSMYDAELLMTIILAKRYLFMAKLHS